MTLPIGCFPTSINGQGAQFIVCITGLRIAITTRWRVWLYRLLLNCLSMDRYVKGCILVRLLLLCITNYVFVLVERWRFASRYFRGVLSKDLTNSYNINTDLLRNSYIIINSITDSRLCVWVEKSQPKNVNIDLHYNLLSIREYESWKIQSFVLCFMMIVLLA